MDFKQIQELVKLVNKSNISELSIEQEDIKITIKQENRSGDGTFPVVMPVAGAIPQVAPAATTTAPAATSPVAPPPTETKKDNLITINSPMIGTFYRSSSPEKPAFVNIGDEVSPGKVVCIIEAMKLFNEIESEISGKIVKVLVEDASPVEYDQPLFLVEPA